MGYIADVQIGDNNYPVGSSLYGTCETAADVANKIVSMPDFDTLKHGVTIHVFFRYTHTSSSFARLDVNGTGAKMIYRRGTSPVEASTDFSWLPNSVVSFTYDETASSGAGAWRINDMNGIYNLCATSSTGQSPSAQTSGNVYLNFCRHDAGTIKNSIHLNPGVNMNIYSGASAANGEITFDSLPIGFVGSSASSQIKAAQCRGHSLLNDSYLIVVMSTSNSYNGQIKLQVVSAITNGVANGTAKPIYINGIVSSSSNKTLPAGTYLVYYDGTNYYFRTDGEITCPDDITSTEIADQVFDSQMTPIDTGTITQSEIDALFEE